MNRPTRDATWLQVACVIAGRSTCLRRSVGCVLVDARGHVLSTGYNGVAMGQPHCNEVTEAASYTLGEGESSKEGYDNACPGALAVSGTQLDGCRAIHAEQNALLQCRDVWQIATCYCTTSPCMTCVKLLLATSCRSIVFLERYPHVEAEELWTSTPQPGTGLRPPRDWVWYKGRLASI